MDGMLEIATTPVDLSRDVVHYHYWNYRQSPTRISAEWCVPGVPRCFFIPGNNGKYDKDKADEYK